MAFLLAALGSFILGTASYSWGVRRTRRGLRVLGVVLMFAMPLALLVALAVVSTSSGET